MEAFRASLHWADVIAGNGYIKCTEAARNYRDITGP